MTSAAIHRHKIQQAAEAFFSEGSLRQKMRQASALNDMDGLESFATALPWQIKLPQDQIFGYSETFNFAMRDIQAQLILLAKSHSMDTPISLAVDAARLPGPRNNTVPLNMPESS